jgi:hypothetical protein
MGHVGQSHVPVTRSVASPVVISLRHLPACVGIHPVWCVCYIFHDMPVTVETLMLRSLQLGFPGPIRRWGFAWDRTWRGIVWRLSETFRRFTRGPNVVWWPVLSRRCGLVSLGRPSLTLVSGTVAWHGLGRSLRLARLLGRDLVVHSASQGCSAGTWLSTLPRKVARQGLGGLLRLPRLLGGDLVACSASQGCSAKPWWFAPSRKVAR